MRRNFLEDETEPYKGNLYDQLNHILCLGTGATLSMIVQHCQTRHALDSLAGGLALVGAAAVATSVLKLEEGRRQRSKLTFLLTAPRDRCII